MDERTLGDTAFRGDLYKIVCTHLNTTRTELHMVPGYAGLSHADQIRMSKARADLYSVLELMAFPVALREYMQDKVNPVHRPVIEQLMTDLQALLDAMPAEEQSEQPDAWELAEESAREAGARKAQELVAMPQAAFDTVQQATAQTKKLCREENISVVRVNSSYVSNGRLIQTIVKTFDDTSDATYAKLVAVLNEAGYTNIHVHTDTHFVSASSKIQGMFHMA